MVKNIHYKLKFETYNFFGLRNATKKKLSQCDQLLKVTLSQSGQLGNSHRRQLGSFKFLQMETSWKPYQTNIKASNYKNRMSFMTTMQ
jgi:hypothetical protein